MALVKWKPSRDIWSMQDEMNRLFDRFFGSDLLGDREMLSPTGYYPNVDVSESKEAYVVTAELPGLKKEDVHITFQDGMLMIEGERKAEKEEKDVNYHRVERSHGKFCRTFQIPSGVREDKISANYRDGILNIVLPKTEESKPKEIEVKVS